MLEKLHVFPALRQRRVAFGEQEGEGGCVQCGQGLSIGPEFPAGALGRSGSLVGHGVGMGFPRITIDPAKLGGPCIRGLRIPVTTVYCAENGKLWDARTPRCSILTDKTIIFFKKVAFHAPTSMSFPLGGRQQPVAGSRRPAADLPPTSEPAASP
jgi:hypothetical protein